MDNMPLKDRLADYIKRRGEWVPSGELQRLVMAHTTHTPRTAVRRLQELAAAGVLEVTYIKNHSHYKFRTQ